MADSDGPTRRKFLTYGGSVAAGGLLAGCTGSSESDATATDAAAADTAATAESTATSESTAESTADGSSYTVSMAPMGDVTFEGVPESIFTRLTHHAGMAFALGHGDAVNSMHAPDYYDALWNQFTPRLPGVELDWTGLYSSWEPSKERLYELDSDVHLADPASVSALGSWSQADLDEIEENVGPWFGNSFSARHQAPPTEWADAYEYYGLWEIFAKVAQVLKEEAKYEALAAVREELLAAISADLPAEADRPTAVLLGPSDLESIYAYNLSTPGFLTAHTRPLKPVSAFGDDVESGSTVDFETLLEADPDVILTLGGMHPNTSMPDIRAGLRDDPVGAEISAVRNDRVYAQAGRYQGPILNLFQLEMTAKQLYPDQFGAWPQYSEGPYPDIPEEEQLFDRQRVADIINGNL
ncbi:MULTISPECIES: ABC transporter substrate-binding protein [Haloferax]|uniref:Periplasmic binding protein n=1 Tax=Haloferax massiliensis TaxID=1476858 RepID=A0A0D6JWY8_9EURY|nr:MULTISPECIES: ABC transporter substrate-binding protein [Haloferax]MDS0242400.1 ABC transporter substrate-binding protein [Haloferax sp. S2CR25]MDS0445521.1 ABC transporter substrate-binding protein [Haloferax sp. S2CR25-2]CQR53969.1 Periplasmic binding protein [Haloferax massiliensis]CQR54062.1 Periplasmic binding protein [Haloferax massiliensis]